MSGYICRRIGGRLLRRHYCSSIHTPVDVAPASAAHPAPPQDAGFIPQSSALAGKPLSEIVRSWMVFKLLSNDWIVRNSLTLYNVSKRLLGPGITRALLRASVSGQFLGGFSEDEAKDVAERFASRKICSIWNFSTEQDLSEESAELSHQEAMFDKVNERYLKSIRLSGVYNYLEFPVKLAAIKLTGIVQPHILCKLGQMLEAVQRPKHSCEQEAQVEKQRTEVAKLMSSLQVGEDLSTLEEACRARGCEVSPWTPTEKEQLARLFERLDKIGQCAVREGVRVLVDGEESRLQPAIHHLTVHHMMPRFNTSQPFIYNTVQMYCKESLEALLIDIAAAKTTGFSYGVKLVRGAYMHYEREISEETGQEYPLHPSKEATDANYDRGVRSVLEEIAWGTPESGVGGLLVATHNRESVERAVESMKELGIPHDTDTVCFGQLSGMADYLTYGLVERGYTVQKILAYGEEKDVIPFLVRRAQENNKTPENAQFERKLYGAELGRRLMIV